jgi:hypothetical protein
MIDDDGDDESEDVEDEGSGKWAFLTVGDVESMDVLQVKEALQERGLGAEGNLKKLQKRLSSSSSPGRYCRGPHPRGRTCARCVRRATSSAARTASVCARALQFDLRTPQ